jgi:ABC-type sugar transport system substrate-binding protein
MAQGLFVTGFSVAEVLQIQARAKELLVEGKTVMAWGDSGSSVTKQFSMTVKEVLEECAYALRVLDPATYGRRRNVAQSRVDPYFYK